MNSFTPRRSGVAGPEAKIQRAVIAMLKYKNGGWLVIRIPGSKFLSGMPDLFCTHRLYGVRLIEIKLPNMKGSRFTNAQIDIFPKLCANGSGVWILTAATDAEYDKLFKPFNWVMYLIK